MKKFNIEYSMSKVSIAALWNKIHMANGLSEWFADRVDNDGDIFTFTWSGQQQKARLLNMEEGEYIRFHWLDEEQGTFFEMRILLTEITGEVSLLITDHAADGDQEDLIIMWNRQVEQLRRRLGV
ncbi:MAG: hypothetical protein IJ680_05440 [Paludibacteraceae bacterium]|nr:hypothetical protein [Paludibacteraceae bacterium]